MDALAESLDHVMLFERKGLPNSLPTLHGEGWEGGGWGGDSAFSLAHFGQRV